MAKIPLNSESPAIISSVNKNTAVNKAEKQHILAKTPAIRKYKQPTPKIITKNTLINIINHIHFTDGTISVELKHIQYDRKVLLSAKPQPYKDDHLECIWVLRDGIAEKLENYKIKKFIISSGQQFLQFKPQIITLNSKKIIIELPDFCQTTSVRKTHRYPVKDTNVYFFQNSALFYGKLIEFNALTFKVEVMTRPPQTFQWIDSTAPVNLIFYQNDETLYTGDCRIIKQGSGRIIRNYVLAPLHRRIKRFKPKEFRCTREKIVPSPVIYFIHPLTRQPVNRTIIDLSGCGFSVLEDEKETIFLPGLIIQDLKIIFADNASFSCIAQVVYSNPDGKKKHINYLKCGLAILDMKPQEHALLVNLINQLSDPDTYMTNQVNPDALWNFFFTTGFIYPQKYNFLQENKDEFKRTLKKLYSQASGIARYFIFQERDQIQAHISMIRFYEKSWLIHHHAAIQSPYNRGGLTVLNQLGRFVNDSYQLYSLNMDWLFCYFRPDNKFPNQVFGGVARNINDLKGCSIDKFAYTYAYIDKRMPAELPATFQIKKTSEEDFMDLHSFYESISGGLMLEGLSLTSGQFEINELAKEYEELGFTRKRLFFSLKQKNRLHMIFMINLSDLGLNFSELTNSITVFAINITDVTNQIIKTVFKIILAKLKQEKMPVLFFPEKKAQQLGLDYKKEYNLWVLDPKYSDHYFRYLKRLIRFIKY